VVGSKYGLKSQSLPGEELKGIKIVQLKYRVLPPWRSGKDYESNTTHRSSNGETLSFEIIPPQRESIQEL
jgi:hypothetical protein